MPVTMPFVVTCSAGACARTCHSHAYCMCDNMRSLHVSQPQKSVVCVSMIIVRTLRPAKSALLGLLVQTKPNVAFEQSITHRRSNVTHMSKHTVAQDQSTVTSTQTCKS